MKAKNKNFPCWSNEIREICSRCNKNKMFSKEKINLKSSLYNLGQEIMRKDRIKFISQAKKMPVLRTYCTLFTQYTEPDLVSEIGKILPS